MSVLVGRLKSSCPLWKKRNLKENASRKERKEKSLYLYICVEANYDNSVNLSMQIQIALVSYLYYAAVSGGARV